jgi:glycosyltransferase involved in cell wall biosynthesis
MRSKSPTNRPSGKALSRPLRLAYLVSHPIQYQAPLLKRIASEPDIELNVLFCSDISLREHMENGFGVNVKWDVPLLDGYQYEFLPSIRDNGRFGFFSILNYGIYKRLRDGRFDAIWVHGYGTVSALYAIMAARLLRTPILIRSDSTLFDRPRSNLKRLAKQTFFGGLEYFVSGVLACGSANLAYWRHYFGDRVPAFRLNYAVDNDFFRSRCVEAAVTREDLRNQLGLEKGRPIILFASKLQQRKRCPDLLEAFLRLEAIYRDRPRPYLLIVGDGEERAKLEERSKAAQPGDVRFLGFQNQNALPALFDLCDVFVLASVHEPWGLVINEVMNAGKPVIVSTEVGCQEDLVEDGVNGYVVQPGDIDALATALDRVLADPSITSRMGLKSLNKIQPYSFEQNVSGLRIALQTLVPGFSADREPSLR